MTKVAVDNDHVLGVLLWARSQAKRDVESIHKALDASKRDVARIERDAAKCEANLAALEAHLASIGVDDPDAALASVEGRVKSAWC